MILRSLGTLRAIYQAQAYISVLTDFLVPDLLSPPLYRRFSTTPKRKSRIGSATLSLPQEVSLRLLEPPPQKQRTIARSEPLKTVEVEGPLGTLMFLGHDFEH